MLAVTGIGMVSSLGLDAPTSCAAARAGIRRIGEIDALYVMDAEEAEVVAPASGHRVPLVTSGFFGFARLLQLGVAGLADLERDMPDLRDGRLGIVLLAGGSTYGDAWLRLARSRADGHPDDLDTDEAILKASDQRIRDDLLRTLLERSGLRVETALTSTLLATCTSLVTALGKAQEWLRQRACDRCIVGALDSLVDPTTLETLNRLGLLRTPSRSVGMIPGETASFHVLELAGSSSARRGRIHAILDGPVLAAGAPHPALFLDPNQNGADTLADAIAETIAKTYGGSFHGMAVANLNGDEHRAAIWADVLVRLRGTIDYGALPTWLPCLSFGDVGAAVGGVSITMLAQAWRRRYAPAQQALVCLLDDIGGRAVIPVRAPAN